MKSEELRIGNYINPEIGELDDVGQVKYIGYSGVGVESDFNNPDLRINLDLDLSAIQPIPLTEEWLEEFGFEKIKYDFFWVKEIIIFEDEVGFYNESHGYSTVSSVRTSIKTYFKHVHSLQNLYHALTGEELEIK